MESLCGCVAEERSNVLEDRIRVREDRLNVLLKRLHVRKDRINALEGGKADGISEWPSSEAGSTHGRGDLRMGNGMGGQEVRKLTIRVRHS